MSCSVDGSAKDRPCEPMKKYSMLTVAILLAPGGSVVLRRGSAGARSAGTMNEKEDGLSGVPRSLEHLALERSGTSRSTGVLNIHVHFLRVSVNVRSYSRMTCRRKPTWLPSSSCALVGDGDDAAIGLCTAADDDADHCYWADARACLC